MAKHETPGRSDEWYTPPYVFEAMGATFDMDVAHPGLETVDWIPAREIITENSLTAPWRGFVWMNAPFGGRNGLAPWLDKFIAHGDGVALVPDRTSAPWWQEYAPRSTAVLFVARKIRFIPGAGTVESSPAQGTTLLAMGGRGVRALDMAANNGLGTLWWPSARRAA